MNQIAKMYRYTLAFFKIFTVSKIHFHRVRGHWVRASSGEFLGCGRRENVNEKVQGERKIASTEIFFHQKPNLF